MALRWILLVWIVSLSSAVSTDACRIQNIALLGCSSHNRTIMTGCTAGISMTSLTLTIAGSCSLTVHGATNIEHVTINIGHGFHVPSLDFSSLERLHDLRINIGSNIGLLSLPKLQRVHSLHVDVAEGKIGSILLGSIQNGLLLPMRTLSFEIKGTLHLEAFGRCKFIDQRGIREATFPPEDLSFHDFVINGASVTDLTSYTPCVLPSNSTSTYVSTSSFNDISTLQQVQTSSSLHSTIPDIAPSSNLTPSSLFKQTSPSVDANPPSSSSSLTIVEQTTVLNITNSTESTPTNATTTMSVAEVVAASIGSVAGVCVLLAVVLMTLLPKRAKIHMELPLKHSDTIDKFDAHCAIQNPVYIELDTVNRHPLHLLQSAAILGNIDALEHIYEEATQHSETEFELLFQHTSHLPPPAAWMRCVDSSDSSSDNSSSDQSCLPLRLFNSTDDDGNTALCWSVVSKQLKSVQWLLAHGIDCNKQNNRGQTPLTLACMDNAGIQIVEELLKAGANPNITDAEASGPVHYAARCVSLELLSLLIRYGANLNTGDCEGLRPLMIACSLGRFSTVEMLLQNKSVNIECKDARGNTALHWAARMGEIEAVKLLLNHEANPVATNDKLELPLHLAVSEDNLNVSKLLLSFASTENIRSKMLSSQDVNGCTPQQRSIVSRAIECISLFSKELPTKPDSGVSGDFQSTYSSSPHNNYVSTAEQPLSSPPTGADRREWRRTYMRKYRAHAKKEYAQMCAHIEQVESDNRWLTEAVETLRHEAALLRSLLVADTDSSVNPIDTESTL
eukprot:gene726-4019_t